MRRKIIVNSYVEQRGSGEDFSLTQVTPASSPTPSPTPSSTPSTPPATAEIFMINNPAGRVVDHQVYCRQLQWKVAWSLPGSRKRITTPRSITHTTSMPLEMLVTTRSFCFLGTIYTIWETCTTTPMDRIQGYASIVESVTEVITEHKEFGTIWPSAWSSVCGHQTILKRRKKGHQTI